MSFRLVTADACNAYAPISQFVLGAAQQPPVKFTPICVARVDDMRAGDLIDVSAQAVLSCRPDAPYEGNYEGFTKAELFSAVGVFVSWSDWTNDKLVDISSGCIQIDKQDATDAWYSIGQITNSYPLHPKSCKWLSQYWGTYWIALVAWSASGAATQGNERLKVVQSECYLHARIDRQ